MFTRSRKRGVAALLVLAAVALVTWMLYPRASDKQLIEQLVAQIEDGVETKSGKDIMSGVAGDYRDPSGLDRTDVLKLVLQWVRSPEQADITITDYEIDVKGKTATGRFDVQVLIGQDGRYTDRLRLDCRVEFEKQWQRWHRRWLVKSMRTPSVSGLAEGYG